MADDILIIAVPDCNVVKPALYGVLSVLPPQLTIRLPDGPALAIASKSATTSLSSKLLFSIITELSEKQQKERNYEIFSSIEQYEKGYPNETAVLGWILVLGSGEGNSRYVHKG